jgi:hypothetical protein
MASVIAYKFLAAGGVAPFTGFRWPVGEWVDACGVDPCERGIHACTVRDLPVWLAPELWEVELGGDVVEHERKLVAPRGRLTRRIHEWNTDLELEFGNSCVQRTRERVGFLPVLSGYVWDVERFVAQRRIAIAGFAAARAAELRDGPAGYEEERLAQASWLAPRLGIGGPGGRV